MRFKKNNLQEFINNKTKADDPIRDTISDIMDRYNQELKEVVKTLDVKELKKFTKRWSATGILPECFTLADENVLNIAIRKMALQIVDIPEETKESAKAWLLARGYDLEIKEGY